MAKQASQSVKTPTSTHNQSSKVVGWILITFAALLLLLAQSSMWVKNTLMNQTEFKSIFMTTIMQEQNRNAVASKIVDEALKNRPVIKNVAGDRLTSLVSGLLASDMGERIIGNLTTKIYSYVTRPNPQNVQLNLTVIKEPLAALSSVAQTVGAKTTLDTNAIPDTIVLVNAKEVPNLNGVYVAFIWLAPIFWLLTLGTFSLYVYLGKREYAKRVYRSYIAVVIVGIICLMVAAYLPSSLGAMVSDDNVSEIVTNLTTASVVPFSTQAWIMLGVTTLGVAVFALRFRIRKVAMAVLARFAGPSQKAGK